MKDIKLTPMVQQYLEIKEDYADTLVFFRLGDFYELFFDDAIIASKLLELTLTKKQAGNEIPMCGFPHHSSLPYINKLINQGYKVAICEQVSQPGKSNIVKREVVKVITPGQVIDQDILNTNESNYIAAITYEENGYNLAYLDLSTGESYSIISLLKDELKDKILDLKIKEIVVKSIFEDDLIIFLKTNNILINSFENDEKIFLNLLTNLDKTAHKSAFLLLNYLSKSQKYLEHLQNFIPISKNNLMKVETQVKNQLEIFQSITNNIKTTLFYYLKNTSTPMGQRYLKKLLDEPILDINILNYRYSLIESLNHTKLIYDLDKAIDEIYDISRIVSKISVKEATPKDLYFLRLSLEKIPNIISILEKQEDQNLLDIKNKLNPLTELVKLIKDAIVENPSFNYQEGGFINPSFNQELKELYDFSKNQNEWLKNYIENEKEKTKIKNLKIGYTSVFGFYIEISKANNDLILPEYNYERRQTLVNSERYITKELKEYEDKVLNSKSKILKIEFDILEDIKNYSNSLLKQLQTNANTIALLDAFLAMAKSVNKYKLVKPILSKDKTLRLEKARHLVVEQNYDFVKNDILLNNGEIQIITGPNMGGKSTYMRMVAQIVYLAHTGMFVPADLAIIPIYDGIYTRIGSSDDIGSGKSTFMVEMLEANNALKNATSNSLILFDEIGRGTATFDGMALAFSIITYIHDNIKAHTLFSTHYHELCELETKLDRVSNYYLEAKVYNGKINFLYNVKRGKASKSYGVLVAKLANLDEKIIKLADKYLKILEEKTKKENLDLFNQEFLYEKELDNQVRVLDPLLESIKNLNLNNMTPIDSLNFLLNTQKQLKERDND